jgi:hypothetical protein
LLRHFLVFAPPPPVSQTEQKNDDEEEAEEEAGEEDDANPFFFKIFYNEDYVVLWVPVMVRGEVTFAVHKRSIQVRYVVQPPRPSVFFPSFSSNCSVFNRPKERILLISLSKPPIRPILQIKWSGLFLFPSQ